MAKDEQLLKAQTWVLRVYIHCEGCKRKVKKVVQSIEGVYTTTIDAAEQKVTVTGNVDSGTLIKGLLKAGKKAELWSQQKPPSEEEQKKEEKIPKEKKKEKGNKDKGKVKNSDSRQPTTSSTEGDNGKGKSDTTASSEEQKVAGEEKKDKTAKKKDKTAGEKADEGSSGNPANVYTHCGGAVVGMSGFVPNTELMVYRSTAAIGSTTVVNSEYMQHSPVIHEFAEAEIRNAAEDPTYLFSDENANSCSLM